MMIPDLKQFPTGSPPSPYGELLSITREGQWGHGFLSYEFTLRAVGWRGDRVQSVGGVPDVCIDKLVNAYARKMMFTDYRGLHTCEVCPDKEHRHPRGQRAIRNVFGMGRARA